jgi:tetratricopeptide (TPR) repeat protein
MAAAVGAIGAILLAGLWFGTRRTQQQAGAVGHHKLGNAAKAGLEPDHTMAKHRAAIWLVREETISEYGADAFNNYGNDVYGAAELEEAIAGLSADIRLGPDNARVHTSLGIALADQGKLDEAAAEYRRAIRLDPDRAEPHYDLAVALLKQGKSAEAIAEFQKARDTAQTGAELARLIDWELVASGR